MTRIFEHAVASVSAMSDDLQDELARILLQFAGIDQPVLVLTAEEEADLAEADAEIERGELASDDDVRALWAKFDP